MQTLTTVPEGAVLLRAQALAYEAEGIVSIDLCSLSGEPVPPFDAGAHLPITIPGVGERSYSIIGPSAGGPGYVIAVRRVGAGSSGSQYLCDALRPGDILQAGNPRNAFPLFERAPRTVFIAGGIGITPILAMIRRLETIGRDWFLHYAARSQSSAAFLDTLRPWNTRIATYFSKADPPARLDIARVVAATDMTTHLYCCGPSGMLAAFKACTASRPPDTVHLEYFTAPPSLPALEGFTVELKRRGGAYFVAPGSTILDTLLAAGLRLPHSCRQGVCGTCETRVVAGTPDHRDTVLSTRDRASNKTMMICRSGCIGQRIVLDL